MTNAIRALLLLVVLTLAACGFHLRGSNLKDVQFAFKSLYLKSPRETPFVADLRRILLSNRIELTSTADKADLVLDVVEIVPPKQILSLSGAGRVQEYQLFYSVSLRAYDSQQNDWLPADEISLSRILPYDDTQVFAKQQEEEMLYKDMRSDAVAQAIRRLNRAKPQP
jgi:LPS-assembly lipoprotein